MELKPSHISSFLMFSKPIAYTTFEVFRQHSKRTAGQVMLPTRLEFGLKNFWCPVQSW